MRNSEHKLEALKGALQRHTSRLRQMTRGGMPDASEVDRETALFENDVARAMRDFEVVTLNGSPAPLHA